MGKLFGVNISKLIADEVGPGVLPATLIRVTAGTRTTGNLSGGTNPTDKSFNCRGFIDEQGVRNVDGTLVENGTKKVVLIGDTISGGAVAPSVGDKVKIEGTTYQIKAVDRDPAAATYTLVVRQA